MTGKKNRCTAALQRTPKKKEFHSMKRQRSNGIKSTRIIRWSKGDYVEEQY